MGHNFGCAFTRAEATYCFFKLLSRNLGFFNIVTEKFANHRC